MTAPLFSPAALAQMRALNDANLPHVAELQDTTLIPTGGGSHTETWATVATHPCRLAPITQDAPLLAEQAMPRAEWRVVFAAGTPVAAGQRLVVAGVDAAGAAWTKTLDVVGVEGPRTSEVMRRVRCLELPVDVSPVEG